MKIALGTVQFGLDYGISNTNGKVKKDEVEKILNFAINNQIDTIDTASGYGESEKVIGMFNCNNFKVITKTSPLKSGFDSVLKSFYGSLKNLKTSCLDGLLIHNIDEINSKQFDDLYKELGKLKQLGLVKKIGFSSYTPEQVDFLLLNFDFDLIQVPFNVFDCRLIQGGQLLALKKKNIEVHARSIFLQGLLLMKTNQRPKFFNKWHELLNNWDLWLEENNLSNLEAALSFALSEDLIHKIVIGVNSESQLKQVINASRGKAIKVPKNMNTKDEILLNPSFWNL